MRRSLVAMGAALATAVAFLTACGGSEAGSKAGGNNAHHPADRNR